MDMITYVRAKKYADKAVATGGNTELIESMVTEEVTKVVAGADADFDTLKEVADWIKNDKTGAAKMQVDIGTLKTDLEHIELTPGPQGPKGDKGDTGATGKDGAQGPKGADGKTAYKYAQDGGYTGTEEEFANDLHEAMNPAQADWEQNDENAIDYIKNKPFGETGEFEEVELFNQNVAFRAAGANGEILAAQVLSGCPIFANGITYKIIIGTYEYVGQSDSGELGNESLLFGPPIKEGEPFYCFSSSGVGIFSLDSSFFTETNLNIAIYQMKPIINSLPRKFIEEYSAGYKADIQNYEYDGQIYNSNFGAEIFNDTSNKAIGEYSHAEGNQTITIGAGAHAEGGYTKAIGSRAHAEGSSTQAIGNYSHAEGMMTKALGNDSHAEGSYTEVAGDATHAEGWHTIANTPFLHVQGAFNIPEENPLLFNYGYYVEQTVTYEEDKEVYVYDGCPSLNRTTGIFTAGNSHKKSVKELKADDYFSMSDYSNSVIENYECLYVEEVVASDPDTNATTYSFVIRQLTASPRNTQPGKYLHIVGNGDTVNRSNAHTLEADGTAWYQGDIYVGSTSGVNRDEGSKKLATEDYVNSSISTAKNELLNGAGEAYDTLKELGELIDENQDAIEALEIIAASKSDWNENDPSSSKYIENKPFGKSSEYTWVEILNNPTYTGFLNMLDFCPTFTLGATYKVTFNDSDYICTCKYSQLEGSNYLGATINFKEGTFIPGQDDDIPFCLLTADGQGLLTVRDSLPENFIIYEQQFLVNKLDEQFIPDTIARKEDIEKLVTKEQVVGKKTEGTVVTFEDKEYTCGTNAEVFNDLSTNLAIGEHSHAEGSNTVAIGMNAHAEGSRSQAIGNFSHAENASKASGTYAHSEGSQTVAAGNFSHAEGWLSEALAETSHTEGQGTCAAKRGTHVQGTYNEIDMYEGKPYYMPATLGLGTDKTFNSNDIVYVLEDPELNFFTGEFIPSSAKETLVKDLQVNDTFALSNTNIKQYYWLMSIKSSDENQLTGYCVTMIGSPYDNLGKYAHIVGNGGGAHSRSNAHTLDWDGNAWYAGSVECTSFILKSSTEGSNKRFRVTIDDNGELHTEEIVE